MPACAGIRRRDTLSSTYAAPLMSSQTPMNRGPRPAGRCNFVQDCGRKFITMSNRERTTKIILLVFGIVQFGTSLWSFVGAWGHLPRSIATPMLESVVMTLGVFLVLASRNPPVYRSVILYGAWANIVHGVVMVFMTIPVTTQRAGLLIPAALAIAGGALLLAYAPPDPLKNV
jgi:hypothetical protein